MGFFKTGVVGTVLWINLFRISIPNRDAKHESQVFIAFMQIYKLNKPKSKIFQIQLHKVTHCKFWTNTCSVGNLDFNRSVQSFKEILKKKNCYIFLQHNIANVRLFCSDMLPKCLDVSHNITFWNPGRYVNNFV